MALKNMMGDIALDDSIVLLRRLCDLLESGSVVDSAGRQRIVVDATSGTSTVTGSVSVSGTVTSTITAFGLQDHRQYADPARIAYNGLRSNLIFS